MIINLKRVLIAHQSTIPHYRVSFFNTLERLKPNTWRFDVVFDPSELESPKFFHEQLDIEKYEFPLANVKTYCLTVSNKRVCYQTFFRKASKYDLIIVENAVNNLTYPLCHLHKLINGTKVAYWGHGKDRNITKFSLFKFFSEKLKLFLSLRADGFFAYTEEVKSYLVQHGLPPQKVFVVNNTIDINEQRRAFEEWRSKREKVHRELGIQGKKVLLFVGRFTQNKKIDFLLKSFSIICQTDPTFHLLLVGSEGEAYIQQLNPNDLSNVSYFGPIVELSRLAPIYVASDVFSFPGSVGLGPLQALCYDLPIITVDSSNHMPEIEYLSPRNSIVLSDSTSPEEYAHAIINLYNDQVHWNSLKDSIWPSIQHLTIEQMAQNFIMGINIILGV